MFQRVRARALLLAAPLHSDGNTCLQVHARQDVHCVLARIHSDGSFDIIAPHTACCSVGHNRRARAGADGCQTSAVGLGAIVVRGQAHAIEHGLRAHGAAIMETTNRGGRRKFFTMHVLDVHAC